MAWMSSSSCSMQKQLNRWLLRDVSTWLRRYHSPCVTWPTNCPITMHKLLFVQKLKRSENEFIQTNFQNIQILWIKHQSSNVPAKFDCVKKMFGAENPSANKCKVLLATLSLPSNRLDAMNSSWKCSKLENGRKSKNFGAEIRNQARKYSIVNFGWCFCSESDSLSIHATSLKCNSI